MNSTDLTTAERIRILLKRQGMNMTDLAEKTQQTRQNLSNKMGRSNFTEKELASIAEAVGCKYISVFVLPDGTQI